MFKAIALAAVAATTIGVAAPAQANPIINNHNATIQRAQSMTGAELNYPRMGGTTTLKQKCEAYVHFNRTGNFGKQMEMIWQMNWEHPIEHINTGDACRRVGVYGVNL